MMNKSKYPKRVDDVDTFVGCGIYMTPSIIVSLFTMLAHPTHV